MEQSIACGLIFEDPLAQKFVYYILSSVGRWEEQASNPVPHSRDLQHVRIFFFPFSIQIRCL